MVWLKVRFLNVEHNQLRREIHEFKTSPQFPTAFQETGGRGRGGRGGQWFGLQPLGDNAELNNAYRSYMRLREEGS